MFFVSSSVVDRYRFDADPDPTFHSDDDLDRDPVPTPGLRVLENQENLLDFSSRQRHAEGVRVFSIWTIY